MNILLLNYIHAQEARLSGCNPQEKSLIGATEWAQCTARQLIRADGRLEENLARFWKEKLVTDCTFFAPFHKKQLEVLFDALLFDEEFRKVLLSIGLPHASVLRILQIQGKSDYVERSPITAQRAALSALLSYPRQMWSDCFVQAMVIALLQYDPTQVLLLLKQLLETGTLPIEGALLDRKDLPVTTTWEHPYALKQKEQMKDLLYFSPLSPAQKYEWLSQELPKISSYFQDYLLQVLITHAVTVSQNSSEPINTLKRTFIDRLLSSPLHSSPLNLVAKEFQMLLQKRLFLQKPSEWAWIEAIARLGISEKSIIGAWKALFFVDDAGNLLFLPTWEAAAQKIVALLEEAIHLATSRLDAESIHLLKTTVQKLKETPLEKEDSLPNILRKIAKQVASSRSVFYPESILNSPYCCFASAGSPLAPLATHFFKRISDATIHAFSRSATTREQISAIAETLNRALPLEKPSRMPFALCVHSTGPGGSHGHTFSPYNPTLRSLRQPGALQTLDALFAKHSEKPLSDFQKKVFLMGVDIPDQELGRVIKESLALSSPARMVAYWREQAISRQMLSRMQNALNEAVETVSWEFLRGEGIEKIAHALPKERLPEAIDSLKSFFKTLFRSLGGEGISLDRAAFHIFTTLQNCDIHVEFSEILTLLCKETGFPSKILIGDLNHDSDFSELWIVPNYGSNFSFIYSNGTGQYSRTDVPDDLKILELAIKSDPR